ncbi:MAG: hypothetical protein KKA19_07055 [Candidatus Margulisbacteria bacterium]|nr:hypothetical protein [Candidatus Margulisiibacteriota bacterium]
MKLIFRYTILFIVFLIFILPANSATYKDTSPVEYMSIRQMAMGGAGVAIINGAETTYLNPAAITKTGTHFNFPLIPVLLTQGTIYLGDNSISLIKEYADAMSKSEDDKAKSTEMFTKLVPKTLSLGGSFPYGYVGESFLQPFGSHMAIAGYTQYWAKFSLLNPVIPRIEYKFRVDTVMGLTFARQFDNDNNLIKKILNKSVGYTIKHINRISAYDIDNANENPIITITDLINETSSVEYYDANGWGIDLGFLGEVETILGKGNVGLSFYNIGARLNGHTFIVTSENAGVDGDVNIQVPTTAKLGVALENNFLSTLTNDFFHYPTLLALDYDIVYPSRSYVKRMHLGLEQPLSDWLFWQMGLNQGYGTMGLQCRWSAYTLGLAYFTEELGREVGQNPNTIWLLNAGLLF